VGDIQACFDEIGHQLMIEDVASLKLTLLVTKSGALEGIAQPALDVVGSPRGLLPEAPTDPDVRNYRIRLFSPRLRYVTWAEWIRGCGKG